MAAAAGPYQAVDDDNQPNGGNGDNRRPMRNNDIDIYVSDISAENRERFRCSEHHTVYDLTERVRSSQRFGLTLQDTIDLYERVDIPGNTSTRLRFDGPLPVYRNRDLIYHVRGRMRNLDDIQQVCCRQNIAFFGAPTHGKTCTINTIGKCIGYPSPIAQGYQPNVAGTRVYTPYELEMQNSMFKLWDVPGEALSELNGEDLSRRIKSVLCGYETPHRRPGSATTWRSQDAWKIHTAVSIQNGTSGIEGLHVRLRDAARDVGRAIPMFIIITHIDQMNPQAVRTVRQGLVNAVGIDNSAIFTIANDDYREPGVNDIDPQKEEHMRSILRAILGASKMYKENMPTESSCQLI